MLKTASILFLLLHISARHYSQVAILEAGGWFESLYVTWEKIQEVKYYNVYFNGEGISDSRINDYLIREYDTYFRADIPGLKPGSYTIAVTPVIDGEEQTKAETAPLIVIPHDRSGFAFTQSRVPGAYKPDGTPKANTLILYITEQNKNTLSLNVTGANANPCIGLQQILDGFKKGKDERPLIIRIVGQITDLDYMLKGDIVIENKNNPNSYITFEGIGNDAVADGWGIRIKNASNIEIRNIAFMNCDSNEGDNISLQQKNEHIWVHHCDFFYGHQGGDSDQEKGDGALDSKRSGNVSIAYNHFWDSGKTNLLGIGTEDPKFLSYHHNWYDHSDSRHPRVNSHSVHVYNNYFDGISKYGVGATVASSVFVESNYFRNCRYPMLISMQGSDVYNESSGQNDYSNMPTFSKDDGGMIKAFNNFMSGQKRFVEYGSPDFPNTNIDFDAVVTLERDTKLGEGITSFKGQNSYNNFDMDPAIMYHYEALDPLLVPEIVMESAGRINGGDFQWIFTDEVDDTSFEINEDLKNALVNYQSKLVRIQAEDSTNTTVKDQTFVNTTKVFPNPARDHIQIYSEERIDAIHILDMIGKLVYISPHPEPYVNIGDLKSGMYHLQLTSSGKNYTIPLFKL